MFILLKQISTCISLHKLRFTLANACVTPSFTNYNVKTIFCCSLNYTSIDFKWKIGSIYYYNVAMLSVIHVFFLSCIFSWQMNDFSKIVLKNVWKCSTEKLLLLGQCCTLQIVLIGWTFFFFMDGEMFISFCSPFFSTHWDIIVSSLRV